MTHKGPRPALYDQLANGTTVRYRLAGDDVAALGAISIPLAQLTRRLDELPADLEVVAYCRGAYCVFSHEAVRLLRSHGGRALRLADGIVEWQAEGRPLSTVAA